MNVVLVSVIYVVGSRAEIIVYRCFLKTMTVGGVGGFGKRHSRAKDANYVTATESTMVPVLQLTNLCALYVEKRGSVKLEND